MIAWGITDVGLKRRENQDTYAFESFIIPNSVSAVVCDGMGGVRGGQLASSLAVSTYMAELRAGANAGITIEQIKSLMTACVAHANRAIYDRARENYAYYGMGTTLVSAVAAPDIAVVCNIGDSRAYHIGEHGIRRITRDHSVVEELIESGDITREEARTHPNRNLITRALGPDMYADCDCFILPIAPGDYLLLCSDGLIVTMEDYEILDMIRATAGGERTLTGLLELSKQRGAPDNVTVVLIHNDGGVTRQDG